MTSTQPDMLLQWLDALADSNRLRLMRILEKHELGVVELCEVMQSPQSSVSRHLKVLLDQKLLKSRRRGTNHLYAMVLDEMPNAARQLWLVAREQTENWATSTQDHLRVVKVLAERAPDSQSYFAGAAGQWDRIRGELYGSAFDVTAMLAMLPGDLVVADLGCGTGEVACRLAEHVKKVVGVDNSDDMLEAAQRRSGECGNVELRKGELTQLPMSDGEVDGAVSVLALTYVDQPVTAIREMSRVVKAGGTLVIVDLLKHDRDDFRRQMGQKQMGFDAGEMKLFFEASGMEEVRVKAIEPDRHASGPALFAARGKRKA